MVKNCLFLSIFLCCFTVSFLAESANQRIKAGISPEFINGADAKVLKYLAQQLQVEIEFVPMPLARRLQAIKENKLDILINLTRTQAREKDMIFLDPAYASLRYGFFKLKENSATINSYQDLVGKTVGVIRKSKYFEPFDNDDGITRFPVATIKKNIELLLHKRIDAFIYYPVTGKKVIADMGAQEQIELSSYLITAEHLYIAIAKESRLLGKKAALEEIIKQAVTSGKITQIQQEHYGVKF